MPAKIASLATVARRLDFVRETLGPNRGAWVHFIQRHAGGRHGEFWCADFVYLVADICYDGAPPLKKTGSCDLMLADAKARGFVVAEPAPDDLFFFLRATNPTDAYHVGIVTQAKPVLMGIAGNTSPDGTSANGTGVFEHRIVAPRLAFVRLP